MHDRLTLVQPSDRAAALTEAIRIIREQPLRVDAAHTSLLDAVLAAGDFERARALLGNTSHAPALPLFLARYVRWTGDLHTAAGLWDNTLASLEAVLADEGHAALRRAVAAELAATATDLGHAALAARLHRVARTDAGSHRPDEAPRTAAGRESDAIAVVHEVAFDILGIDPDATRGRLRLRPALDRHVPLHARNIRFADATVSLRGIPDRENIVITVTQESGSIPITVLLEPFLVAAREVTVDGQVAELEPQEENGRVVLRVQLVLDADRTLVVHGGR